MANPVRPYPYSVGLLLWNSETTWCQIPATCSADTPVEAGDGPPVLPTGEWLVTSHRVAGRLKGNTLRWWTWDQMCGMQVDLVPGREVVCLDVEDAQSVYFRGPGIAPLGVAAVYSLHGAQALLDHPGLGPLRTTSHPGQTWSVPAQPPNPVGELEVPWPNLPVA